MSSPIRKWVFQLASLVDQRKYSAAVKKFEQMKRIGVPMNINIYNVMINCYGKSGNKWKMLDMMEALKREGFRPDAVSYNTAMNAARLRGCLKDVLELRRHMSEEGVRATKITDFLVIDALGRAGNTSAIAKELADIGRKFSESTIHSASNSFAQHGDLDALYSLFLERRSAVNSITCCRMLRAAIEHRRVNEMIEYMKHLCFLYHRHRQRMEAQELHNTVHRESDRIGHLLPSEMLPFDLCQKDLIILVEEKHFDALLTFYRELHKEGFRLDSYGYQEIKRHFELEGKLENFKEIIGEERETNKDNEHAPSP
jgi:pentatricopeptide repeat protein